MKTLLATLLGILYGGGMSIAVYYMFNMSDWTTIEKVLVQWLLPIAFGCSVSMGTYLQLREGGR